MNKLLSYISLILIITLLSAQLVFADDTKSLTFTDLDETYWAYAGINKLVEKGIIVGYPDGTFQPEANIKRSELVKIVNMVFKFTQEQEATTFTDVKEEDWFYKNVLIAQNEGYIVGYPDGSFEPEGMITREEFCKVLDVINNFVELPFEVTLLDEVSPWAFEYVNRVISNRIMVLDENNNFRAREKATRAEVCDALAKFILEDTIDHNLSPGNSSDSNDELTRSELYDTIDRVVYELSAKVINNLESATQKEIVTDIIDNMNAYKADNTHDYEKAAGVTYEKYKKLSEEEREALKYEVQIRNATKDLLDLQEFFFPDVEI